MLAAALAFNVGCASAGKILAVLSQNKFHQFESNQMQDTFQNVNTYFIIYNSVC